ncbi:MAG: Fucose permease [Verrucomicrobia bacterium]|nr:MAG: Fucose permease [Verrucomicrobiota bacterium]
MNSPNNNQGIVANAHRLLWAGFMAILAAGVGFALRGGIFGLWAKEYGFTATQLGAIGGAGFTGFCFGIIIGGVIVDKLGYGKLVALALVGHILSAVVTFGASTPENAYDFLYWGMFIFAYANGTLEAVANPLVATVFPQKRMHYLNILHASWPLGMVVGAAASYLLGSVLGLGWKGQLSFYLVPTAAYAIMFMGQSFPKSEAAAGGASMGSMFKDVGIIGSLVACYLLSIFLGGVLKNPTLGLAIGGALVVAVGLITRFSFGSILLFVLFLTHALVGAVELGTDGWIESITGNLFTADQGKMLFIWTSSIMFGLRFCAHFIETKLGFTPISLLLLSAVLAAVGLTLASGMQTFSIALAALGIYALGKTFFWPTMLAVVGDRFPRSGAVAMSIMGGIGMLSAGLLGGPGLGYSKDRFASEALKTENAALYEQSKSATESKFLFLSGINAIDGKKLEEAKTAVKEDKASDDQKAVVKANQAGDRATLKADSFIPMAMAAIYLLLMFYFKAIGGYRPVSIEEASKA